MDFPDKFIPFIVTARLLLFKFQSCLTPNCAMIHVVFRRQLSLTPLLLVLLGKFSLDGKLNCLGLEPIHSWEERWVKASNCFQSLMQASKQTMDINEPVWSIWAKFCPTPRPSLLEKNNMKTWPLLLDQTSENTSLMESVATLSQTCGN